VGATACELVVVALAAGMVVDAGADVFWPHAVRKSRSRVVTNRAFGAAVAGQVRMAVPPGGVDPE
jgi:hypothetical protein